MAAVGWGVMRHLTPQAAGDPTARGTPRRSVGKFYTARVTGFRRLQRSTHCLQWFFNSARFKGSAQGVVRIFYTPLNFRVVLSDLTDFFF
jgi:hypothetical protein